MKFSKSFYIVLAIITIGAISSLDILAEERPTGDPLFSVTTGRDMWSDTDAPGDELTSLEKVGGTKWITKGFTHSYTQLGLWTGVTVPYVARLSSVDPVPYKIGIVSADLYYDTATPQYLNGVYLQISKTADFDEYETVTCEKQTASNTYWNFYITEPEENMYYRLCVDFEGFKNNWICLTTLLFYEADDSSNDGNKDDEPTSIVTLENDKEGAAKWYDMLGREVLNPEKGVYIKVTEGQSRKVRL